MEIMGKPIILRILLRFFEIYLIFFQLVKVFGLKAVFFELLHAKAFRIIWTLSQKVSFESETCKNE